MKGAWSMAVKAPTNTQITKHLTKLLDDEMSLGDRAAITRTIQILKGERSLKAGNR